jgi:rod shape-determining protein MreC
VEYPVTSVGNFFKDAANLWQVYQDNVYLNEQLAQQKSYQTLYQDERNRNLELQAMLEMKDSLPEAFTVTCTVLSRPLETWDETFTISAGSQQGVSENMLVSSSDGAVGLVKSVQTATSTVELLTSPRLVNNIAVLIALEDGTNVEGVLQSYDESRNAYCISLFNNDAVVTNGALVSTSGKGGNYPSGIYVGSVTGTVINDDAIVKTIYVKPVSNMNSFNYVTVIGRKDEQ